MNRNTVSGIGGIGGFLLGGFLGASTGDELIMLLLGAVFALAGFILGNVLLDRRNKRAEESTKDALRYDSGNCTLTVYKRLSKNKKRFYLESVKTSKQSYTPEKLVYTSVSSGVVTTGGFHIEGGTSTRDNVDSGRCRLRFYETPSAMSGSLVKRIQLSNELLEQAKKSPISRHIVDDCLLIEKPEDRNWAIANAQVYGFQNHNTFNASQQAKAECYPTYAEANEILSWLSGK